MKLNKKYMLCLALMCFTCLIDIYGQTINTSVNRFITFDNNWKFKKGLLDEAKNQKFNDRDWRTLDLPHDWSIEDLTNVSTDSVIGPFSKKSAGKNASAYTVGGKAWYRKTFVTDKNMVGKNVYIQFDGVYMNSDVWINGQHLGNHKYGYTSFIYDLSPYLKPQGQQNVIAVEVKNEGNNSRWYSGSGIYRHVWLHVLNKTHIDNWGVQIVSNHTSEKSAIVNISVHVTKDRINTYTLITEIIDAKGNVIANQSSEGESGDKVEQRIEVKNPTLWDIETPYLYKAKVVLKKGGKKIDEYVQNFGIRTVQFNASQGFLLNGKNIKLKGGCLHHDNGPLGAVAIDRAEERKIELLKKNGYNAVRFSHNPYSTYLLDVCDRLGLLVVDEAFDMWNVSKSPDDYSKFFKENWQNDLQNMIIRDRNHPSIIMWSIGNEIPEIADSLGYETSKKLAHFVKTLDTTRPITNAIPIFIGFQKGKSWDMTAPSFAALDVAGYNYANIYYEKDHQKYPNRVMMATETFPPRALENWNAVEKNPYVIGMFSWAAIDYLGEAGLGLAVQRKKNEKVPDFQTDFVGPHWPVFNSYTGELDLIGNKKVASYYLDVVWRRSPIEMVVHRPIPPDMKEYTSYWGFPDEYKSWTFPGHEKDSLEVRVFTRSEKVRLVLNNKVIAEQRVPQNSITASFKVPYTSGKLVAHSFDGDKETGKDVLITADNPYKIGLVADRKLIKANNKDLSYIQVSILDKNGNVVTNQDDMLVKYEIAGEGVLVGVANGNPKDMSSFQKPEKRVWQGKGLLIIKSTNKAGKVTIKATANGVVTGFIKIKSE